MITLRTERFASHCLSRIAVVAAITLLGVALTAALGVTAPDRSHHFPADWTSLVLNDCEQQPGWESAVSPSEARSSFGLLRVSRTTAAKAAGAASCRWEFQPLGENTWAELRMAWSGIEQCDALSLWLKNPQGLPGALVVRVEDADGAVYNSPAATLGEERNWYELAFYLREFQPVPGMADPRPGISFPLKSLSLSVGHLQTRAEYDLYLDELRAHSGPAAQLDVIELMGPREVEAGSPVNLRVRLRAQSPVAESLDLTVGLALQGTAATRAPLRLEVPAGGVQPGHIFPPCEVTLPTAPRMSAGDYEVTISANRAQVTLPPPERLPTSRLKITSPGVVEPTTSTIDLVSGAPRIKIGDAPVAVVQDLSSVTPLPALAPLSVPGPRLLRFRVAIGKAVPGAASVAWTAPGEYRWEALDAAVSALVSAAPAAYLLPELVLRSPEWWDRQHAQELFLAAAPRPGLSGPEAVEPSFSSPSWLADGAAALQAVVSHLEQGPFADRVAAYQVAAGLENRWLSWDLEGDAYGDYSEPQRQAFQRWLRDRYGDLPALRGAWGQPVQPSKEPNSAPAVMNWSQIRVPATADRSASEGWVLDPSARRPVVDYRLFASQAIAGCLDHFAGAVKTAAQDRKVCGAAYGHFMELAGRDRGLEEGGHLALTPALGLKKVDFLVGPPADGQSGALLMPTASLREAAKAYVPALSGAGTGTLEALAGAMEQGAPAVLPDTLPATTLPTCTADAHSAAEIAVIVDDESAAYFGQGNPVKKPLLCLQMEQVRRLGAPVDVWLLQDVLDQRLPRYKMYLFLNAFQLGPQTIDKITQSFKGNPLVVWFGAPGALGITINGRQVRQLTGISVSPAQGVGALQVRVMPGKSTLTASLDEPVTYGIAKAVRPLLEPLDTVAQVLGTTPSGGPGLVSRRTDNMISVFSLAPGMPQELLRSLAVAAGVHIYDDRGDRLYATRSMVGLTPVSSGQRVIRLPQRADVYELPAQTKIASDVEEFTLEVEAGVTRLFTLSATQSD